MLVEDSIGCPSDYEPFFHRMWNGTYDICSETMDDQRIVLSAYYEGSTTCNGIVFESLAPINMTSIDGMVACGLRGGDTFMNQTRVDIDTLECP